MLGVGGARCCERGTLQRTVSEPPYGPEGDCLRPTVLGGPGGERVVVRGTGTPVHTTADTLGPLPKKGFPGIKGHCWYQTNRTPQPSLPTKSGHTRWRRGTGVEGRIGGGGGSVLSDSDLGSQGSGVWFVWYQQ